MRHRRLVRGLALGVTVLLVPALASAPVDAAPSWQRYIVGPPSRDVRPVAVTQVSGDVTNPQGVLGAGVTTLHRPPAPAKTRWPAGTTATASSALTNGLLGVTPASPGFATFTVEPHPGPVAWARGQVPTPHGPITVSW
ncbi:MAG TPA: alpha-L-rhamnosidase C-terminal domain-containing protein, partial [Amycolatopsis sp.]